MHKGVAASEGIAIGRACVARQAKIDIEEHLPPGVTVEDEVGRFHDALELAKRQLADIAGDVACRVGTEEAAIFEAHICLLEDEELAAGIISRIRQGKTASWAVTDFMATYKEIFAAMDDPYLRERAQDLDDLTRRMIKNLHGVMDGFGGLTAPAVIVAHELTPSDTAQLDREMTLGFVTETGGKTSHAAIMARAMGIPAVVGLKGIAGAVKDGDMLIIDGDRGVAHINPSAATLAEFTCLQAAHEEARKALECEIGLSAETRDQRRVELFANIGSPGEVVRALACGAEGVGLFRTEFLFMDRQSMPSEEEQFAAYRDAARGMGGKPVIIRTLDIGGDKDLPYLNFPAEANPFLGVRAIRLCLVRPDLFRTQLRAILRASAYGEIWIMYPMVAKVEEITQANEILAGCKQELDAAGVPFNRDIKVGIMVEIPSTAVVADIFARHVDFFSIGTNDLIQYTLAADRMNENLAHLYDPFDPAVLRLISGVIAAGRRQGIVTGMCGEMAGDPLACLLLLGMGLDEFSASPASLPQLRRIIRSVTMTEARELVDEVMGLADGGQIKKAVHAKMAAMGINP